MKTTEHSSVPRAGGHQVSVKVGQAAVLSTSAVSFFASLVLQEQLLRDPTHSCTWLPPSLPQGLPRGGAGKKGLGKGAPRITLVPPISPPGRDKLPPQRQGRVIGLEEPPFPGGSPKMTQSQALGCGARAGLLEI